MIRWEYTKALLLYGHSCTPHSLRDNLTGLVSSTMSDCTFRAKLTAGPAPANPSTPTTVGNYIHSFSLGRFSSGVDEEDMISASTRPVR